MKKYGYSMWFMTAYLLSLPGSFIIVFLAANILSGYLEPDGQAFIMILMLGIWAIGALFVFVQLISFRLVIMPDSIAIGTLLKKKIIPFDKMKGYTEDKMDGKNDYSSLSAHTQQWMTLVYLDPAGKEQKERLHLNYFRNGSEMKDEIIKSLFAKKVFLIEQQMPPPTPA